MFYPDKMIDHEASQDSHEPLLRKSNPDRGSTNGLLH